MPDQPTWLERVPDILAELNEPSSPPFLDRPAVELLFGLRRRQAITLMHRLGGYQVGKTFLVDRAGVIAFLTRPATFQAADHASERKRRLLEHLATARRDWSARKIRIPALPQPGPCLPEGVELQPGELKIRFEQPIDLLQKLFALSEALTQDYERLTDSLVPETGNGSFSITPGGQRTRP